VIHVAEVDAGFTQTIRDGFGWQARPMFDAPKPLLFGGGNQGTVVDKASRGIAMLSVKAENQHFGTSYRPWPSAVNSARLRALSLRF